MNRVARWRGDELLDALAVRRILGSPRHAVTRGDRSAFDAGRTECVGALSCEQADINEYFVPIMVKCIGDPAGFEERLGDRMGVEGKKRLRALLETVPEYRADAGEVSWKSRWEAGPDGEGMATLAREPKPYAGFYEIVATKAKTDGKAVLVGYSQGGLVARFLAFLDEHLMPADQRSIAGFITVHAPNAGSPLANPLNAETVARGIFAILAGTLTFPVTPPSDNPNLAGALDGLARGTLPGGDHFDITAVCAMLDAAALDAGAVKDAAVKKATAAKQDPKKDPAVLAAKSRLDMVLTAQKWLSGLSPPKAATAFRDLSTATLGDPRSILGLLDGHVFASTYHGATIGTDNGLSDFVASGRPWWARLALRWARGDGLFGDSIKNAEAAFSQIVMNENLSQPGLTGREKRIADAYSNGCHVYGPDGERVELKAAAHDFVIPSVAQALGPLGDEPPPQSKYFLGNVVNPKGTHISGGDELDPDWDGPYVARILDAMGRKLP